MEENTNRNETSPIIPNETIKQIHNYKSRENKPPSKIFVRTKSVSRNDKFMPKYKKKLKQESQKPP